jgi:hypothetical protein
MQSRRTEPVLALAYACLLLAVALWVIFIYPSSTQVALPLVLLVPALVICFGVWPELGVGRRGRLGVALAAGLVPVVMLGVLAFAVREKHGDQRRAIAEFNWYATRFPEGALGRTQLHDYDAGRWTVCAREALSKARVDTRYTLFCLEVDADRPEREGVTGGFRHADHGLRTSFDEPFDCFGHSARCAPDAFD